MEYLANLLTLNWQVAENGTSLDGVHQFNKTAAPESELLSGERTESRWLQVGSSSPTVQSKRSNQESMGEATDDGDEDALELLQNHLNETYFLDKEEKYLQAGGEPLLTMEDYDRFEQQLEKDSE